MYYFTPLKRVKIDRRKITISIISLQDASDITKNDHCAQAMY